MSQNQGSTQNKTPSVMVREIDISLWKDLLHFAEHILNTLEEEGCIETKDKPYYEAIREALLHIYREYFVKGNEEQEIVFKVALIEVLKIFVDRLFFCI